MIRYIFFDKLLIRCPLFSYNDYKHNINHSIDNNEIFITGLYAANKQFFKSISNSNNIMPADEKSKITLLKYLNRSTFRPTPMGLFASFSILDWTAGSDKIIWGQSSLLPHYQFDFHRSRQLATIVLSTEMVFKLQVYPNNSIYKAGNEYRYYKAVYDPSGGKTNYLLQSFNTNELVINALKLSKKNSTLAELAESLKELFGLPKDEINEFCLNLINEQLLHSEWNVNIVGDDFVARLLSIAKDKFKDQITIKVINDMYSRLDSANHIDLQLLLNVDSLLRDVLPEDDGSVRTENYYVNLERRQLEGGIGSHHQLSILNAIDFLKKLRVKYPNPSLIKFVAAFKKKFEQQYVPLLIALDPEIGIGYGDLNASVEDKDLLNLVSLKKNKESNNEEINWLPVNKLLLKLWPAKRGDNLIISNKQSNEMIGEESKLPDNLIVVFRSINNQLLIEQVGGISATTLIGRFTPFNKEIHAFAKTIAEKEMAQNPGIIFAEIAYVANDHVDNINRRQHIWPFEIPVLTHSTLDAKDQIPLDDLWLTVDQDDRVILISKKHQKQVVPRLSSAYNFMNSDLAAFRFLCDLQYPDDRSDFSFNFQQLFPGLDYYPRVQIESVIISLATWELSANNFDPILKKEKSLWYDAFKMLAENIALCNQFTLAKNDQELMFELQNEDSILFFLSSIQKMDKITLKEFISEAPDKALVTDRAGKAYINQFIAALHNGECDHQPSKTYKLPEKWAQKNFIGSEWIYIKLYCHEDRSDYLLHKYIYPALKRLGRLNNNLKWFYVRYYDPEHHIRLRIKTSEWHIFESFKKALTVPINDGFISALNTELYKKELIRYSERLMPYVEQFFCADSALTLHFINKQFTNQTQLKTTDFALLTTIAIIKFFKNDEISSVDFCNVVFNGLLTEYSNPKQIKIDLDQKFRLMKGEIETLFTTSQLMKHLHADKLFKTFNDQLDILKKKAEPANVDSLLSDLVHMHLNRIFNSEQRSQEMVVYFLLYKYQKSVYARKKSLL